MQVPSRQQKARKFTASQITLPFKNNSAHVSPNDHSQDQLMMNKTFLIKDGINKLPILNLMNSQIFHINKLERSVNSNKVPGQTYSVWQNVQSIDKQTPLDLDRTISQGQFGNRFNQVHTQSQMIISQTEQQFRPKVSHLFQLFEQTARLIEDFTIEKQDNLNGYFTQIYQQVQMVVKLFIEIPKIRTSQIKIDEIKVVQISSKSDQKNVITSSKLYEQIKEKELSTKNVELYLTNQKLAREIEMLSQRLKLIEQDDNVVILQNMMDALKLESQQKQQIFSKEQTNNDRTISKQSQMISQFKQNAQKQATEIINLQTYIDGHDQKYYEMESTYQDVLSQTNHWREIAKMEFEDIQQQKQMFETYKVEQGNSKQKLLNLQFKIDRLTIERSKQVDVPEDDNEYEDSRQSINVLRQQFIADRTYFAKSKDNQNKGILKKQQDFSAIVLLSKPKKEQISRPNDMSEILLHKYTYARQNFLVFFESQSKTVEIQMRTISSRKLQLTFFGTLRAIMDAMYNEYLFLDNYSHASHFVDFVYSWLSNFQIDKISRGIIKADQLQSNQPLQEDSKLQFLLDTLNPKVHKLWECMTYNEFLLEQNSKDDLYFYLHCRHMIFRGPCVVGIRSTFDVIQYIKIEHAEFVVDIIMRKYEFSSLIEVKKQLREKAKKKNLNSVTFFVDAYFVLRILLEFYRIERKSRLKILQLTFLEYQSQQSNGKIGVSFLDFKKIFKVNFPKATDLEMCFLYRESYMLGDGSVIAETFFTAATDSNFFLKSLQLQSFNASPTLDTNLNKISKIEENDPYTQFYKHIELVPAKHLEILKKYVIQFGLEQVSKEMDGFEQLIKQQFQDPWQRRPLIMMSQKLVSNWQRLRNIKIYEQQLASDQNVLLQEYLDHNKEYISKLPFFDKQFYKPLKILKTEQFSQATIIENDLIILKNLFDCLNTYDIEEKLIDIERNIRIKCIQRQERKKINKFYNLIGSVLASNLQQQSLIKK